MNRVILNEEIPQWCPTNYLHKNVHLTQMYIKGHVDFKVWCLKFKIIYITFRMQNGRLWKSAHFQKATQLSRTEIKGPCWIAIVSLRYAYQSLLYKAFCRTNISYLHIRARGFLFFDVRKIIEIMKSLYLTFILMNAI